MISISDGVSLKNAEKYVAGGYVVNLLFCLTKNRRSFYALLLNITSEIEEHSMITFALIVYRGFNTLRKGYV